MELHNFLFILVSLITTVYLWTQWIEPNWFRLHRETIRVNKSIKKPLTILHISDLHFTKERPLLRRFFDRLAKIDSDFVFVTGDLIDSREGIGPCVEHLKKLKSRRGIYAVLGNHDYRIYPAHKQWIRMLTGKDCSMERPETNELKKALQEAGVKLLVNQNMPVPINESQEAVIIGIDDPVTGRADFSQAFRGIENGTLHIALVHAPASFPSLRRFGIDAAFAGHTHGGQIRFPGIGPIPLARRLSAIIDSTDCYGFAGIVSRGLGAQDLTRLRLFCRPEAILVRIEGM